MGFSWMGVVHAYTTVHPLLTTRPGIIVTACHAKLYRRNLVSN
jgi:hypothetical protein